MQALYITTSTCHGNAWIHAPTNGHAFGALLSYFVFLVTWSIYGIVYMLDDEQKNVSYHVLDWVAKALVGILFWMYFTGAVVF